MSKQNLDLIKPFGPWIAKIVIPEDIVNKLNEYVDQVVADEEKSKKQNAGKRLVGNVTQEFQIDGDFVKKSGWGNLLAKATTKFIEVTLKKNITKFEITDTWVVRQFANVDYDWFNNNYDKLTSWLEGICSSELFIQVMNKYNIWNSQDGIILINK